MTHGDIGRMGRTLERAGGKCYTKGMPTVFDLPENDPLRVAHKKAIFHRAEIEKSRQCGCFYCKKIFGPEQIVDWTDTNKPRAQQTALCPACGIDSVIGDASGLAITEAFLEEMRTAWFCAELRWWPSFRRIANWFRARRNQGS